MGHSINRDRWGNAWQLTSEDKRRVREENTKYLNLHIRAQRVVESALVSHRIALGLNQPSNLSKRLFDAFADSTEDLPKIDKDRLWGICREALRYALEQQGHAHAL